MPTVEDVTKFWYENMENITMWVAEWDIKPGFKIVTFSLKDKSKKVFEIDLTIKQTQ